MDIKLSFYIKNDYVSIQSSIFLFLYIATVVSRMFTLHINIFINPNYNAIIISEISSYFLKREKNI